MGLDNGIMLKIKDKKKFGTLPPFLRHEEWEPEDEYEVLYWRKCWNIREEVFSMLHSFHPKDGDNCVFSVAKLEEIIYHLNDCYEPKWWNEHDDSIWDFNDICKNYHYHLLNAMRLVEFLKEKDPGSYELYFYDSY